MHNSTRILEVSTYTDLRNRKPWRSNVNAVTQYGRFNTQVLRIPIQQLLKANNRSCRRHNIDHFVKNLKYVSLTHNDVEKIVAFSRL
jgi:hypothetical protein